MQKIYLCETWNNVCETPNLPTEGDTVKPAIEPILEIESGNEFVDGIRTQGDRQKDILGCLKARVL